MPTETVTVTLKNEAGDVLETKIVDIETDNLPISLLAHLARLFQLVGYGN